MRLVSYPLSVLAVVAASYGLAHVAARPTVAAAPAVRTSAAPPPPVEISEVRAVAMAPSSATIAWHTSEPVSSRIAYGVGAPTLWTAAAAPSLDHVATLTGLTYGTSYVLSVDTQASDGRRSSAAFTLQTPGLGSSR